MLIFKNVSNDFQSESIVLIVLIPKKELALKNH